MYIFIFREGVFPRICIILAGMQRGGERVSLCSILSAVLNWGGARRVFLKPISYRSCVYPCRDGSEACHTACQQSEHATHCATCSASGLSHRRHIFPKRTVFLLIFSSQSQPAYKNMFVLNITIFYFPNSLVQTHDRSSQLSQRHTSLSCNRSCNCLLK